MKKLIGKLFSDDKINCGRQYEVDLLRGFTTILLFLCHVGLYLTTDATSAMFYFSDLIGSEPGAPVFMVLMGIGIIFSRHQSALLYLKRGLVLFLGSYLLNLFRSFPYWIVGELDYFACVQGFFVVDIFQFAGLAFLLFALFKAMKMPSWGVFIVSIVFLVTGQILMAIPNCLDFAEEATYVLNLVLPLNNDWCCFNLLTWFIYPCFGLMLGELIIRCKNKNIFYSIMLVVGSLGVVALYVNIGLRFPDYTGYYFGGNFYRMGILNTIITLLYSCFGLAVWYFIGKILPSFLKKTLVFLSKNLSFIYIASWVAISVLIHLQAIYSLEFSVLEIIVMMAVLLALCSAAAIPYNKIQVSMHRAMSERAKRKA